MCRCFRALSSTSSNHPSGAAWPTTARVFKFRSRSPRNSVDSMPTRNSARCVSTVGRSEWLYGIVGGVDLTKTTMLMAELHGTSRTNFTRDVLTVNLGLRHEFSETPHPDRLARPRASAIRDRALALDRLPRPAVALLTASSSSDFVQCAFEAGFCGKIRINAMITTRSANDAV